MTFPEAMKCVYEASNTIEAHLVNNLLISEAIHGRIDGEYLAGGIGELQAIGLIRVMVPEAEYERAMAIIRDWEAGEYS
jgi:hypothetical protein